MYQASTGTLWTIETLGDFNDLYNTFYGDLDTPPWLSQLQKTTPNDTHISALPAEAYNHITDTARRVNQIDSFCRLPKWVSNLDEQKSLSSTPKIFTLVATILGMVFLNSNKRKTIKSRDEYYSELQNNTQKKANPAITQATFNDIQSNCKAQVYKQNGIEAPPVTLRVPKSQISTTEQQQIEDQINAQIASCITAKMPEIKTYIAHIPDQDIAKKISELNDHIQYCEATLFMTASLFIVTLGLALQDTLTPGYRANRVHALKNRHALTEKANHHQAPHPS